MAEHHAEPPVDLAAWAERLRRLAAPTYLPLFQTMRDDPRANIGAFRDEFGHRRPIDAPLLATLLGSHPGTRPDPATLSPDARLWWQFFEPGWDPGLLAPGEAAPLLRHDPATSVEVLTQSELSAMHALWTLGRVFRVPELRTRAINAALWHVDHTQPDNASAHAWGVHVVLIAAFRASRQDARLLAETLIHNCTVWTGTPDRLSACLLMHAAMELDALDHP